MKNIYSVAATAIEISQWVAILVGEPQAGQRHVGIWYLADDDDHTRTLHLAWHCQLQNDDEPPGYFTTWVSPAGHRRRLPQLAAYCRRVWEANSKSSIPYSLSPPNDSLDAETGEFLIGGARIGLTCASFVLAVFHGARMPIADCATWPANRPGDHEWQLTVVSQLEQRGADAKHVQQVRAEIGAVRFRPEEVAACAALAPPPADCEIASALGQKILAYLQAGAVAEPAISSPQEVQSDIES